MFDCIAFGERLRQARKNAGLTMTQAGNKAYLSQSTISRYESGEMIPTFDRVYALAEIYGCSLDWLCGRTKLYVCVIDLAREVTTKAVEAVKQ